MAISLGRRTAEVGEITGGWKNLQMALLDWEKTFDEVHRVGLMEALKRMRMPPKLLQAIQALYKNPKFTVEAEGGGSDWFTQETGIRQGCPAKFGEIYQIRQIPAANFGPTWTDRFGQTNSAKFGRPIRADRLSKLTKLSIRQI